MGTQKNRLSEHPKHMLKLIGMKIVTILCTKILFISPIIDGTWSDADVESRSRKGKGKLMVIILLCLVFLYSKHII